MAEWFKAMVLRFVLNTIIERCLGSNPSVRMLFYFLFLLV